MGPGLWPPRGPGSRHTGCPQPSDGNPRHECALSGPFASVQGETPLHTACRHGLASLTAELLQQGANPNLQTEEAASPAGSGDGVYLQTPLHMAIAYNHPDVVSVILEQKGRQLGTASLLDLEQ